jgi:SNF2 family DNA or RNA helicase
MTLNLTLIPAKYWMNSLAKFTPTNPKQSPPQNSAFFLLWSDTLEDLPQLDSEINRTFPDIPIKKLIACSIRLAKPLNAHIEPEKDKKIPIAMINGRIIPIPPAIKLLFQLKIIESKDRSHRQITYSDSVKTWAYLTKFTMEIISRGNFVPILDPVKENLYEGKWKVILKTQNDHLRFNSILQRSVWAAYNLPINFIPENEEGTILSTSGLWHPSYLFADYADTITDFMIRSSIDKAFLRKFSLRYESTIDEMDNICYDESDSVWDLRFLTACIGKNRNFQISRFCDTPIPGILRNWVQKTQGFSFSTGIAFTFRLDYPKTENADWELGYFLQPLHDLETFIPLEDLWDGIITHNADYATACDDTNVLQEEVLRALGTASKMFPPIRRSLEGKNPHQVKLQASEVMDLLRISMYLLIQTGFNVVLPEEFTRKGQQRLSAKMVIRPKTQITPQIQNETAPIPGGASPVGLFTMDSMMEFEWEAKLEGKTLTQEEFMQLANSKEPLIFWRGQWILIDQTDMNTLRPIFQNSDRMTGEISYTEALKLGFNKEIQLDSEESTFEVALEGDFRNIVDQISQVTEFQPIAPPKGFQGQLRPYQEIALTWLGNMAEFNFGVCLADDMGLGKTIEVISFLQYFKERYPKGIGSVLVVCPTSVLFNWKRELHKFAPQLEVITHHGTDRLKGAEVLKSFTKPHKIILTTYGTVRNDIEFLETIPFTGVILDESQNIKNYRTQQTKSILALKSQYRIALSGTPIENRLAELWTLFEFLNPGLLGKRKEFQQKFILPIERFHDEAKAEKLKKFISPFILRRLKTDKSIISDLPEKNEIKIYLELSESQIELYSSVVQSTMQELERIDTNDSKRRGLILRLLTQTKQICNHPFQYLHLTSDHIENPEEENDTEREQDLIDAEDTITKNITSQSIDNFIQSSVKLERLREMIDEVLEDGEKMLIFTQFKQMGDLLKYILEQVYHFPVLFFHGGIPQSHRGKMVDEFQSSDLSSPPIMILSLRAGGTGLNLTQASTVFHFDRWWNPAVEDQATDRVYRIGQQHHVNVYKFIATGTIEEKIDQILEEKRDLADRILASTGETWITSLSNEELQDLFSLK